MHVTVEALPHRPCRETALDRAAGDAPSGRADEHRLFGCRDERRALREPSLDRLARRRAHRDDALLRPLAHHAHFSLCEIHAAHVERGELGQAQAGGVRELEQRAVAHAPALIVAQRHEPHGFVRRERRGEPLRRLRGPQPRAGIVPERAVALDGEIVERTPRGEHARKAAAGQPLRMELREIARELRPRELRERGIARGTGKLAQVAQVRLARVSRPCREVRFERVELGVQGFSLAHCL